MSAKGDKSGQPKRRSRVKASSPKKTAAGEENPAVVGPASKRFIEDVQIRGEAVKPDVAGKLPLSATHAITGEGEDGSAKQIRRARFKLF